MIAVFWGGREGYHTLLNTNILKEQNHMGTFFKMAAGKFISIFHGCTVSIEKSVMRVTDRHHEACGVMPNSDPE